MLVLVAGGTGNVGQKLVDSLLARGHQVRVVARTPSKMDLTLLERLESFFQSSTYYDIPALDHACSGVDAVICAFNGGTEIQVEGQLLLLRAAERAGVKRFMVAAWNYDWRNMSLGDHESYDGYISLRNHIDKTSSVKPLYVLTGVLAEVLFSAPGRVSFLPENNGAWDPKGMRMEIWGTGDEIWHWTTEKDVAEFSAAIIERDDAPEGGFSTVASDSGSLKDIASIYEKARNTKVQLDFKGSVEDLRAKALEGRAKGSPKNFWTYIGYFYQLYTIDGTWVLGELDNEKLGVRGTPLTEFLEANPEL